MKLVNLVARKILEIMGYAWKWLNGLIMGIIVGFMGTAIVIFWWMDDEFDIGIAQKSKKKE